MKIQGLAVIAIVIILPMSILLGAYSRNQIKTLDLQVQYDTRLKNSTYDAIKVFQMNMTHNSTSSVTDSKMRDINASINSFFSSLSSNFNMSGYGKDVLQDYVPAIVYTLYDGYYIYSAYTNTLDSGDEFYKDATYKNKQNLYGLKPYIYYSCRYKNGESYDIVITYTLDSYITIQGKIGDNQVNESGYLLTGVTKSGNDYYYRGVKIVEENEGLEQKVYINNPTDDEKANYPNFYSELDSDEKVSVNISGTPTVIGYLKKYPCKKINGVKYYESSNNSNNVKFSISNSSQAYIPRNGLENISRNRMGIAYYKEAYEFKEKFEKGVLSPIKDLKASYAVDQNGNPYGNDVLYKDYKIFNGLFDTSSDTYIEDKNSDFNAHKIQVIKNAIETNLISAIANYNTVSPLEVNFAMPKLKETEWEELTQNISVMTFLQGLNIGGKIYNGYAIIPNNHNEDYISEDSIYILNNGVYHKVTDKDLLEDNSNAVGILNTDFDTKSFPISIKDVGDTTIYYSARDDTACYDSIINVNSLTTSSENPYEYFKNANSNPFSYKYHLAQVYYTALGRERWGMYRVNNKDEDVAKQKMGNEAE